ncbi:MAG: acyltransferase domain-containing protein [Ruthenibacterium sp.]
MNFSPLYSQSSLHSLCAYLNLPAEVAFRVERIAAEINWQALKPAFEGLFSCETAEKSRLCIKQQIAAIDEDGFAELAVQLVACQNTKMLYVQNGIPDCVFLDTMACFSRFLKETLAKTGRLSFDRGFWTWRALSLSLYRLGTLEFECLHLPNDIATALAVRAGVKALSVHIPSDACLTTDQLILSYSKAKKMFFKPNNELLIYCRTWLLSPNLQNLISENSNIRTFANDYQIMQTNTNDTSFYNWIFATTPQTPINDLSENTSLQRAVKAYLLNGGKIGSATGKFIG